jgi:hypothetical protein
VLILIAIICVSCINYNQDYPLLGGNRNSGDYLINPDNILVMIDQEGEDIFLPAKGDQISAEDLMPYGSFSWTQYDFLRIANALNQYVWGDNMEDWEIYLMFFDRDCRMSGEGFDSFNIIYYKMVTVDSKTKYVTRQIDVNPLAKLVTWGDGLDYPRSFLRPWHTMDFENFEITADEAVQIADANGGKDAREKRKNNCGISVSLLQDHPNKWGVDYYVLADFHILVDPYSGRTQIPLEEICKSFFLDK